MSGSSKTVSALMGWNVNLNIYHRVQSKLLHERRKKKCLSVPVGPCQETWGHCQRGSCRVSVTTSWLSAAAPQGTWGWGGLLLSTGCKWKVKNKSMWLMKRDELLSYCYSDTEARNNESHRGTCPTHTAWPCQAGGRRINLPPRVTIDQ